MENQPVLAARQLSIGYIQGKNRHTVVHKDLSFDLRSGELICLLGPNGAGKSTLLRTISAFQPALYGELLLEGRPMADYTEREKSRKIGVVLTDKTQTGGLTVYELVSLGRQPHTGFWGSLSETDHVCVQQAIEAVGMNHKKQSYVAELSDGERQKAMIAKALVQECPMILLDEPTAFLDIVSRIEIMTLLHDIAQKQHKTILLSTHDIEQALMLADRLFLLSPETGLSTGITEDLVFNGQLDCLFKNSHISFDRSQGIYTSTTKGNRQMILSSSDADLLHWAANLLHKFDYECVEQTADNSLPVLTLDSPHSMHICLEKDRYDFTSFEELSVYLNNH